MILLPGAEMSQQGPMLEKEATRSLLPVASVAMTVMACVVCVRRRV